MSNLAQIGLNQNSQFSDLTCKFYLELCKKLTITLLLIVAFLAGASYAGASITFDLPSPPFIHVPYSVAPFQVKFIHFLMHSASA